MNENNDVRMNDNREKKSKAWLWLIPLLLIPLLLWALMRNDNPDTTGQNSNANQTAQTTQTEDETMAANASPLVQKYDQAVTEGQRTILFNPDAATLQDEAAATASIDTIAAFAKANADAKFQVNGSIFDNNESDASSGLAKQRAELVKERLVAKGVNAANVTVSTMNNYEGKDEAARAAYARSVVVTVKE